MNRAGGAWLVLVATALASMMDGVDATGLAVANPVLAREFGATLPGLELLTVGYMLVMAMALVPAGMVADRIGHRRVFLAGLVAFAASSLLTGLSGSVAEMVVWRLFQGAAGATLAASSLALLRHAFPPELLKVAIGLWSAGLALATVVGPFVGGALVQFVSWRAIFFVNLPIALAAFAIAAALAPRATTDGGKSKVDVSGIALLTSSLFALVSGITRAQVDGWASAYPMCALVASAVLLLAFAARERAAPNPLLPPALFHSGRLVSGLAVIFAAGVTHFGTSFYFALYLQQIKGLSPVLAGAGLLPLIGLVALGGPASGFLNRRFGARTPIVAGLLMLAAGSAGLSLAGLGSGYGATVVFLLLMGLGIGLAMPSAVEVVIAAAPKETAGVAAGLQQTVLMVSGAFGAAIYGSIITARSPGSGEQALTSYRQAEFVTGFGHATAVGAVLTLAAAAIAAVLVRLPAPDASAADRSPAPR
ncbi:MFS transporter [Amycolatopsis sp. CA-230715]|uniref:MFS transporter n=1 Tax=Amycolatopsis sp. CA-230715 TaxID=2745196 RepID=UPI001C00A448|nr:MFS transporter [Amycolatopsis sp. CA-230715]QWF79233.1 Multidrug resistance protein Stp [Amycolatopsis sp. CA-230715]